MESAALISPDGMGRNPHTSTGVISLSPAYPLIGTLPAVGKAPNDPLRQHVERLIAAAGETPTSVSRAAGLNPHYVRQWLNGRVRSPGTQQLKAIAESLGVTVDELTTPGDGNVKATRAPVRSGPLLPVRYAVQAGAWLEVDEAAQARIPSPPVAADPSFPREAQWLELVRGDSADLFYPEGSFVHVVDAVAIGYAPRHEDFVVIERKRQQGGLIERSLKQIAIARRRIELWPRSRNPKWKAPLDLTAESDDDTIEIAALVLGGYLPARREKWA